MTVTSPYKCRVKSQERKQGGDEMKGLSVNIYKCSHGSCSNGGISEKCKSVILVGEGTEVFEASAEQPAVKLVRRILCGKEYIHAEPVEAPEGIGWMFGGTFIHTSDSRFPHKYPIALHDRQESQELYDRMST